MSSVTSGPTIQPAILTPSSNGQSRKGYLAERVGSIGLEVLGGLGKIGLSILYAATCATGISGFFLLSKKLENLDLCNLIVHIGVELAKKTYDPKNRIIPDFLRNKLHEWNIFLHPRLEFIK